MAPLTSFDTDVFHQKYQNKQIGMVKWWWGQIIGMKFLTKNWEKEFCYKKEKKSFVFMAQVLFYLEIWFIFVEIISLPLQEFTKLFYRNRTIKTIHEKWFSCFENELYSLSSKESTSNICIIQRDMRIYINNSK